MPNELFKPMGNPVIQKQGQKQELERVADVDPRLTRSHYFDSRLLTAEDLNRDQIYVDGRLRELGQALGYGVVRGLELSLDIATGKISVKPGLAVSRAGRVLEVTRELTLDIADRADISELNNGRFRRIDRALYAVVVKYSEQGTDIAEVFPTDLGENRRFSFDVMTEGVQFSLVRLPQAFGQQNEVVMRANLLREWLNDATGSGAVPEDGVGLGVLAIANDRPLWLDADLLRQPLRAITRPGDVQADLSRRYDNLLREVQEQRASSSLTNDFAATDYFRLLPPVGALPAESVNPVTGRQGYFPEHFNVWIAPVRLSDVEQVRAESMTLPVIDLASREPVDIVVMVPMGNSDYGQAAQRLERPLSGGGSPLPAQNLLSLKLFPVVKPHELDTDRDAWLAIWDKLNASSHKLFYIRRPLRAAETRLSGIVLARGVPLPPAPPAALPTPADNGLYLDESQTLLRDINLALLQTLRPATGDEATSAAQKILDNFGTDAPITKIILQLLVRIERHYDAILWQTIVELMSSSDSVGGNLKPLLDLLLEAGNQDKPTGTVIAAAKDDLKLSDALAEQWKTLAEE